MTELQQDMVAEARRRNPDLQPVRPRRSLEECFTREPRLRLEILWYNDATGSTRTVVRHV